MFLSLLHACLCLFNWPKRLDDCQSDLDNGLDCNLQASEQIYNKIDLRPKVRAAVTKPNFLLQIPIISEEFMVNW